MSVEGSQKNFVAQNGQPAIHASAAGTNVAGKLMLIHPDRPAGAGIESERAIVLRGGVENAIDHQRRGLKLAGGSGLIDPLGSERYAHWRR